MRLSLNKKSVDALREFANAMPLAIENIRQSTETIIRVYQSVAESIGPHEEEFCNMLMLVKSAQEEASEAIQVLPVKLNKTADDVDDFLKRKNFEGK